MSKYCNCNCKCLKPFKIPQNKQEEIKNIKKRIKDCILEEATLRLELQDLEINSDSSD